jgi:hypothetical protein
VLDDAGHTPMLDRPASFNGLLLAALVGPVPQRAADAPANELSQGDVVCSDQDEVRYSGRFDSITLERCGQVEIAHAQIGQLVVNASTVNLVDSTIFNPDVALIARDSHPQRQQLLRSGGREPAGTRARGGDAGRAPQPPVLLGQRLAGQRLQRGRALHLAESG